MIHGIVQKVPEARTKTSADYGFGRARFVAWAGSQQEAEGQANYPLRVSPFSG